MIKSSIKKINTLTALLFFSNTLRLSHSVKTMAFSYFI
nr:MAG TPA: hypothetical protein [Caudoviricetes sp.]